MSETNNPYAPPQANVADPVSDSSESGFVEGGRSRSIGDGAKWIGDAMRMFFARPGKWLVVTLILVIMLFAVSFIPFVNIFSTFLAPILGAGVAYIADAQRRTGDFEIGDVFKGFNSISQLLIIGAVAFGSGIIMFVCMFAFIGVDGAMALATGSNIDPATILGSFWKGLVLALVLTIPITAATYFAPLLIMLHRLPAFDAMKNSFFGAFKNLLPGLLFFILMTLLMIVSMIPILLGLLISVPVMVISGYTVYRGIFTEESA